MALDKGTVTHIATLARIRVAEEDKERLAAELNGILRWVEQLGEIDTDAVQPMAGVTDRALPRRADVVTDGGVRDAVLANAPERADGFFQVPKVVE